MVLLKINGNGVDGFVVFGVGGDTTTFRPRKLEESNAVVATAIVTGNGSVADADTFDLFLLFDLLSYSRFWIQKVCVAMYATKG